jgi:hypothetical protein
MCVLYCDFIAHLFNATWGWYWRTPQSKSLHLRVALCSIWLISAWTKTYIVYEWMCVLYIYNTITGSNRLLCKVWGNHSSKFEFVVFGLWHCVAAWFMSTDVSGEHVAFIFMEGMNNGEQCGLDNCKQHIRYSVHFQVEFIYCSGLLVFK